MARKKRELKKGDLVTFSSRATKMTNLYRWGPMKGRPPLVGMIVKIKESYKWKYTWTGPNGGTEDKVFYNQYTVSWIGGEGPAGRKYWDRYFIREDLKFVKKLKPHTSKD